MNAIPQTKQVEAPPVVVGAKVIAKALSCTSRYVHILRETGKIRGYRFGRACIRFNPAEVFADLGIRTEAESSGVAQ
jgi:hypothetical protein